MTSVLATVIIPTYNRSFQLKRCLNALLLQVCDQMWEVIVVDDGGKRDLQPLILQFERCLNITLVKQENKGPASARNHGVRLAKGSYIAFLDDDCEPREDWLMNLMLQAKEGVIVGGKTDNKLTENMYSEASQLLVTFLYGYFIGTPWHFFTSNNFMLDKASFWSVGGFDEGFPTSAGEDREFCVRFNHLTGHMKYIPEAIIDHSHTLTITSFWRLHAKYGHAAVYCRQKMSDLGIEPLPFSLRFYFHLLIHPMKNKDYTLLNKIGLISLMLISQLATFSGAINSLKKY